MAADPQDAPRHAGAGRHGYGPGFPLVNHHSKIK
jgi:hypothetical protein